MFFWTRFACPKKTKKGLPPCAVHRGEGSNVFVQELIFYEFLERKGISKTVAIKGKQMPMMNVGNIPRP